MVRRIIEIDRDKCNGCGACAEACHEGAIAMVDGKAQLMRDDYCDGLGDCLPTCPTGAITFVEREAAAYDEQAVMENKQRKMQKEGMTLPCGCPGSQSRNIQREAAPAVEAPRAEQASRLSQWPVQIKLVPVNAPYFNGAPAEREVHPVAGGHRHGGRPAGGGVKHRRTRKEKYYEIRLHRLRLGVRRERGVPGGWHRPRYALERGTGGL